MNGSDSVSDGSSLVLVSRTMNITMDQYSDLAFFLDTPTNSEFYSLIENWNATLSINLTCSYSGSTLLEHKIEDYDDFTAPTWVTLDDPNYQLNVSIPEVESNTDFSFRIRTNEVGSSVYYYQVINLTVLN